MTAVFKKEMKQYFNSMVGYIFLSVFLIIGGYMFCMGNLFPLNSDIKVFFGNIINAVIFLIPMLTMRLLAEGKKSKTEQLLFTLPISISGIVLGKFFAAMCVFLVGVLITLLYVAVIVAFGIFDIWGTLGSYLGFITLVSAFISIGLFISAITENQVIAGILSYVVLLGLWFIGFFSSYLQLTGIERKIMDWLSLSSRFSGFSIGVFDPSSILYFLSVTAIFLFLTIQVLEKRRLA